MVGDADQDGLGVAETVMVSVRVSEKVAVTLALSVKDALMVGLALAVNDGVHVSLMVSDLLLVAVTVGVEDLSAVSVIVAVRDPLGLDTGVGVCAGETELLAVGEISGVWTKVGNAKVLRGVGILKKGLSGSLGFDRPRGAFSQNGKAQVMPGMPNKMIPIMKHFFTPTSFEPRPHRTLLDPGSGL